MKNTESKRVNELMSTVEEKSRDVVSSSVKTVKEVSTEVVSTASEVVASARDVVQEKGGDVVSNVTGCPFLCKGHGSGEGK